MGFLKKDESASDLVSLEERWERGYWTRRFAVTEEELREAIAAVGNDAEDVRKYLRFPPKVARK